ncbi:MAG: STT3 domain-containing protein, partial [Desulfovibrionaceae bacterium]|nr:STT3 domain-containing protein [Desulfovibrionaceae bacterium]
MHYLQISKWDHPDFFVDHGRIMATHDAYLWLAQAEGVRPIQSSYLGLLAKGISRLTGASLTQVGFWTPPILASLVAVVTLLWGWLLGGRNAGVAAGLFGALAPGFFLRSRLGYFDTDIFTLLMPLLVGWMLAYLCRSYCFQGWCGMKRENNNQQEATAPACLPLLAFVFGLVARSSVVWHAFIVPFNIAAYWIAVFLVLVLGRKGLKTRALLILLVFGGVTFVGVTRYIR